MTDTEGKPIDFERMAKALEELAAKPNPKAMTKEDYLRKPAVYASLKKAWDAGYRASDIIPILAAEGFEIAEPTFEIYWRRIRKDMGDSIEGEGDVKSGARSKTNKPSRAAANPSPKPAEKKSETSSPATAGSQPGAGGGKPLGKPTTMGGAFSDDV
ncbi:hypothetical protein FY136_28850 (plasmid) [Agrobacterium tumefaciens]|uniref:hypothetical protein n=1 Tax=Agrobacterium tumefaciens TaxID=358 RepID=UPI0021D1B201|nr:hypothetical protein [Agrobacterium tumefaciens]UXT53273.1 hypothetical protein FY136_28850 [Agrobacterium tumefaciens]